MRIPWAGRLLAVAALVLCFLCSFTPEAYCMAAPLIPRSEMLTVDEIRPGMKGIGKTVFMGTKIESFGITVVGVLRKVDFDGDIILIRITSGPPVTKGFGVIAGMSGSPIYVNGKLIGALAYAWSFAKSPIAGVTPIAQMLEAFRPGSCPAQRQGTLRAAQPFALDGQRIERAVVSPSAPQASSLGAGSITLVPVATPVLVTGMSTKIMDELRKALKPLGLMPMAGAGGAGSFTTKMAPGQAVGARLVGGDLDLTAVGTVTYVKDDVVLAFGHPMAALGATDLPLVAAYVHGILPSSELSFKLASGGQALGRFTEDRPWCIGGHLGGKSDLIAGSLKITDRDRGVVRQYGVDVIRNHSLTSMLMVVLLGAAIESVGPPAEGTTSARFAIEAQGLPRLERENTYTVEGDGSILALLFGAMGAESPEGELSQILDVLRSSEFGEARIGRVAVEVEMSKVRRLARIEDAYIASPTVRAGDSANVALTIRTSDGGLVYRNEMVHIPKDCSPGRVRVGVAGGRSADRTRARLAISEPKPVSLGQMVEQMLKRPGNDELVVDLALPTVGIEARGFAFRDLPPAAIELLRSATSNQLRPLRDYTEQRSKTEWVVSGSTVLNLTVEGEEKDKAGRAPNPEYEPSRYDQMAGGLADLFFGGDYGSGESVGDGRARLIPETGDTDTDSPPPMPSWEEVQSVGETEITAPDVTGLTQEQSRVQQNRGGAVGRIAQVWRLDDPKEMSRGKADGITLLSSGGIALAPRPRELAQVDVRCLWPLVVAPDGSVYTGSWTDGRLRKTAPDGKTSVVLETDRAGVQAVAVDSQGTVYAATVPGGAIYRIRPFGSAQGKQAPTERFCDLGVQNVWALAVSSSGDLWAATGPGGKLFRISPSGAATVVFTAADRHITCLTISPQDTAYVGTSPLGKVYAVNADGQSRAVCEVDKAAVQSIAVDVNGAVYVGTSPVARVLRVSPNGAVEEMLKVNARHVLALLARPDSTVLAAVGPQAKVIAIYPDKQSALIYDSKLSYIAALTTDTAENVYLTASDAGRLVKLDFTGERTGTLTSPTHDGGATTRWGSVRWRGRVPDGSEIGMFTRTGATSYPDQTWSEWQPVALGPGSAVASPAERFLQCRINLKSAGPATPQMEALEIAYLPANRSPEVKLKSPSGGEVWSGKQSVRWSGRDPDGDALDYEVYWSSNSSENWTKIEAPTEDTQGPKKQATGQGRGDKTKSRGVEESRTTPPSPLSVHGEGASTAHEGTAEERGVRLPSPLLLSTRVSEETADIDAEIMRAIEQDAGGDENAEETPGPAGKGEEAPASPSLSSRSTSLKWDTTKVADGVYRVKVVGSDRRANPDEPMKAEVVSRSFIVDNTPPELILQTGSGESREQSVVERLPSRVTAFDRTTYVTSAEFKVDKGEWQAATPGDGIFDGQYEIIVLDAARIPAGSHELQMRVRDAAGNVATKMLPYGK